jgi:type II secretion system protein H
MTFPIGNSQPGNKLGRACRGFTLVEMVLVMALLVVMLAYVAPSLSRFFRGRNLGSEARRFLALTRYGQSRAVSEGIPMLLWVNPKSGTYGLRAQAGYLDQDSKAVEYTLSPEMQIDVQTPMKVQTNTWTMAPQSTRLAQPTICFLPDGFISENSPAAILLRAPKDNDAVWIGESANRLNFQIYTNLPGYARF